MLYYKKDNKKIYKQENQMIDEVGMLADTRR